MKVRFIDSKPFPGWEEFRAGLSSVRPEHALGLVQSCIAGSAVHTEGVFRGEGPVLPTGLHVLLREWVNQLGAGTLPVRDPGTHPQCLRAILGGSREINGLRASHPALTRSRQPLRPDLKAEERIRVLWFHHLEQQGLYWAPKLELGRSQCMFAEIWPSMYEARRVKLESSERTAFLSMKYALLLALGVWHSQGTVADVRELFKEATISDAVLSGVLDAVSVPLETVQNAFAAAPHYPESIQNYFQRYPLARVGEWSVFAPQPDLLLQSWDLRNLFDNLDLTVENVGDRGGVECYRALGFVFEEYARALLRELARESAAKFIDEFRYDGGIDSPDAFLAAGDTVFVFEMKCYRVPRAAYEAVELASFEAWFASLLGKNDKGRRPLVQGASFLREWKAGNASIQATLGQLPARLRYIIVSYEDVPAYCSWNVFRQWYANKHLDEETRAFWGGTTVISVRELETLVGAARGHRTRTEQPFCLASALEGYLAYREHAPDAGPDPETGFKDGLGNWILRELEHARASEPELLEHARQRLFDAALAFGFAYEK